MYASQQWLGNRGKANFFPPKRGAPTDTNRMLERVCNFHLKFTVFVAKMSKAKVKSDKRTRTNEQWKSVFDYLRVSFYEIN